MHPLIRCALGTAVLLAIPPQGLATSYTVNYTNTGLITSPEMTAKSRYFDGEVWHESTGPTFKLAPGESRVVSYSGGAPGDFLESKLVWKYYDQTLNGNSYLATGPELDGEGGVTIYDGTDSPEIQMANDFGELAHRPPNPDQEKTLWMVAGDELTAMVYREGVDKTISFLKSQSANGSAMTFDQFVTTNTEQVAALEKNYYDNPHEAPTFSDGGAGAAASSEAQAAINGVVLRLPSSAAPSEPSGWIINTPFGAMDMNPMSYPEVETFVVWQRKAITWVIVVLFEIWLWNYFFKVSVPVSSAPQARGNPIVGGTGAQATSLVAAGLITVAVISLPTLFFAYVETESFSWYTTTSFEFPQLATSAGSRGWDLANSVFPVQVALSAIASTLLTLKFGTTLYFSTVAVIRWIVP